MEEARVKAEKLIKEADNIDNPEEALSLYYSEAIGPFIGNPGYGFDIIGQSCYKALDKYYKKSDYANLLYQAAANIEFMDNVVKDYQSGNIDKFNLINAGYYAKKAYFDMLNNFVELKKIVKSAFTELKKIFPSLWEQIKKDLKSGNIAQMENALKRVEKVEKYLFDYKVDDVHIMILDVDQKNEYIRGFLQLSDAYFAAGDLKKAQEIKESIKGEAEEIIFLEALKQLIRSFSALQSKLTIS